MAPSYLALFWASVIALSILAYVVLDGFDLGVGMLFGTTPDEDKRVQMMNSIAPYWDGNETWLVVIGAGLFAAFPAAYAVFLGAFYIPVVLLLLGLIFRGIAFEFRFRATRTRWVWDLGFCVGSTVVAFVQGAAIGAMIKGIPVVNAQFAGRAFDWVALFPMLTGIGLVLGYALLGASWLQLKSEGPLRAWAKARILPLAIALFVVLAFAFSFTIDYGALATHWSERPWGLVFPVLGALALAGAVVAARRNYERAPFVLTVAFFVAAYLTLGVTFWPYMIPYAVTVADAAAPDASLRFLFYGAVVVLPIVVIYRFGVYRVFGGKMRGGYE
jgi:cytochrome bd ubiquinol oxidase subunit II